MESKYEFLQACKDNNVLIVNEFLIAPPSDCEDINEFKLFIVIGFSRAVCWESVDVIGILIENEFIGERHLYLSFVDACANRSVKMMNMIIQNTKWNPVWDGNNALDEVEPIRNFSISYKLLQDPRIFTTNIFPETNKFISPLLKLLS